MITLEYILLFLVSGITTFFPGIVPVKYSIYGGLIAYGSPIVAVSVVTRLGAVSGTASLRWFNGYIDTRLTKKFGKFKHSYKSRVGRWLAILHNKIHITNHKILLTLLVVGTTWSLIPDILIIRSVHRKLPFAYFLIGTLIGKSIMYIPILIGFELYTYLLSLL